MKKISIFIITALALVFGSCMDQHDEPNSTYGNPAVKEANTSIKELKDKFKSIASSNGVSEVTEDIVISGVVIGDDESGNIYKNLYISDGTSALVVGINATGLYAYIPVGQKIFIDCKGLYVGGYGGMTQLGSLYQGGIGRMPEMTWKQHVRLEGQPSLNNPLLVPTEVDEAWLKSADKADAPFFVKLKDVTIKEADGHTVYAPEEEADGGNGVNRTLQVGDTDLPFRISSYSNFANDYMPMGKIGLTGLLTQYNNSWQITVRTSRDIH